MALQAGLMFKFNPATSLFVNCETQQEVDDLWEQLSAGGKQERLGWLTYKFGLSWQIIPTALGQPMHGPDPERSQRVMNTMLQMNKIDIQ